MAFTKNFLRLASFAIFFAATCVPSFGQGTGRFDWLDLDAKTTAVLPSSHSSNQSTSLTRVASNQPQPPIKRGFRATGSHTSEKGSNGVSQPPASGSHINSWQGGTYDYRIHGGQGNGNFSTCHDPICTSCGAGCEKPRVICRLPGFNGYPYLERTDCGVTCGYDCQKRLYPNFSVHWPRPFANKEQYCPPNCPAPSRPRDVFNVLANVKLSSFQRRDNGYSGCNCDSFGRLGESHYGKVVASLKPQSINPQSPQPPSENFDRLPAPNEKPYQTQPNQTARKARFGWSR